MRAGTRSATSIWKRVGRSGVGARRPAYAPAPLRGGVNSIAPITSSGATANPAAVPRRPVRLTLLRTCLCIVQATMRHSSLGLTMNVYTDPRLPDVGAAVEALPDLRTLA